jgi:POT family proton-dependent oligopeptide transporter
MQSLMSRLKNKIRAKIRSNPTGLYVLFYTEMWELFGRFSITALLILYLTKVFHIPDAKAFSIYSGFIALLFTAPVLGGYISDRFISRRSAIIFGASVMVLGNALLIVPQRAFVFYGLGMLAMGSGLFLPNIPTLLSDLYGGEASKRSAGFTLYYLGKNLGALLGPVSCGIVGQYFGLNYAFLLSTLGMLSGVVVFIVGQKHLPQASLHQAKQVCSTLGRKGLLFFAMAVSVPVYMYILRQQLDGILLMVTSAIVLAILSYLFIVRSKEERKSLAVICLVIGFVIVFEAFLGQGGTTLNLFIDREVQRTFGSITLPTSFFYSLDPTFMMLMGPFLAGLWMRLAQKGKEPFVLSKLAFALLMLSVGFGVFVLAALQAFHYGQAGAYFVVIAYALFPLAELCIIPISLAFITEQAPKGLEAFMVSVWMLSNAVSSYLTGVISRHGQINFSLQAVIDFKRAAVIYHQQFMLTALALIIVAILAYVLSPIVKRLLT